MVLHDINFAAWYSDHIVAMRDGRVAIAGTVEEVIRPEVLRDIYEVDIAVEEFGGRRVALFYE